MLKVCFVDIRTGTEISRLQRSYDTLDAVLAALQRKGNWKRGGIGSSARPWLQVHAIDEAGNVLGRFAYVETRKELQVVVFDVPVGTSHLLERKMTWVNFDKETAAALVDEGSLRKLERASR